MSLNIQVTQNDVKEIMIVKSRWSSDPGNPRDRFILGVIGMVEKDLIVPKEDKYECIAKIVKVLDQEHEKHILVNNSELAGVTDPHSGYPDDRMACCIELVKSNEGRGFGTCVPNLSLHSTAHNTS